MPTTSTQTTPPGKPPALPAALADARRALGSLPGVLDVRLGWRFRDGWITGQRAWVVTVSQKLTPGELQAAHIAALPDEFQGLPVDVSGPTPETLLGQARGLERPGFPGAEPAAAPPTIRYTPPEHVTLRPVTAVMRVVAHVSPDAGWPELSAFLAQTRRQLVVGMYDCGAPHIVHALEALGQQPGFRKLTLAIQPGASVGEGTKRDDLDDQAVVEQLTTTLADKFEHAWVSIGRVGGWVASSYHIKLAVRDGRAFWLSSGNWQSSNQPSADPLEEQPARRQWLDRYNREWHVIIEHSGLARRLAAYLQNDFRHNLRAPRGLAEQQPDLLVAEPLLQPAARGATWQYFPPFR